MNKMIALIGSLTESFTHSEQSAITAFDFMVEKVNATPLSDAQRNELAEQCQQVVEESTKRGFRVKLLL